MEQRTEEKKLTQEPLMVVLGGKEYEIKPLVIKLALPWRRKFIAMLGDLTDLSKITSDNDQFKGALNNVLVDKPEQIVELFFEYAKDLDKEVIENSASSSELLAAFEEVVALEAPFFGAAMRVVTAATQKLTQ